MNNKIEDMKRQKNLLIAKNRRAEATKTISNTLAGIDDNGAANAFERMKEKVEKNEAEAAASEELALDYTGGDDLEKEFNNLKADPIAQNDALAALKAKMGKGPAPAQAPYASNNYGTNNLANVNSWDDL
jgi:phage shock protein A